MTPHHPDARFQTPEALIAHYKGVYRRLNTAGLRYEERCRDIARATEAAAKAEEDSRRKAALDHVLADHHARRVAALIPAAWSLRSILAVVVRETGVSETDILSFRSGARVVKARQIFYWLGRRFGRDAFGHQRSWPAIGALCNRDHSTVVHGARKVDRLLVLIGSPSEDTPSAWAIHLHQADWSKAR